MAGNSAFELVQEQGWRRGLSNMLDSEFGQWWKTNHWWIQSLIWGGVVGFFLLVAAVLNPTPLTEAVMLYCVFGGLFPAVAVIIEMQDALVGEKQTGTAAWVLSKPVSRPAFILSKFVASSVSIAVTMVLVPGVIAFSLLSYGNQSLLSPLGFLGGLAMIWLSLLFFLSFTLMLGAFFNHRGPVIGIPMALLFLQQYLIGWVPPLKYALPWTLVIPLNGPGHDALAPNLILGQPVASWIPMLVIALEVVVFTALAIWRFNREEF